MEKSGGAAWRGQGTICAGPMHANSNPVRLLMRRDHLDAIPEYPLPGELRMRAYVSGDEEAWVRIHADAAAGKGFDQAQFRKAFGTDADVLARRQLFLWSGSRPV